MSSRDLPDLSQAVRINPGARVWVGGHDRDAKRHIEDMLARSDTTRPIEGPIDIAIITPKRMDEAIYFLQKLAPRLRRDAPVHFLFRTDQTSESSPGCPAEHHDWTDALRPVGYAVDRVSSLRGALGCVTARRAKTQPAL